MQQNEWVAQLAALHEEMRRLKDQLMLALGVLTVLGFDVADFVEWS